MPAHHSHDSEPAPTDDDAGTPAADNGEAAAPMNRAERRAKGKTGAKPPVPGKIQPGHVNAAHGHRSYSNRRSG